MTRSGKSRWKHQPVWGSATLCVAVLLYCVVARSLHAEGLLPAPGDIACINKTEIGFTLIELSIVLVIVGLLVGGILTGKDLIRAAEIRAQMTQIERFNTAVNTFREKFDAMPGDLDGATATRFGFTPRGSGYGEGDGDGILTSPTGNGAMDGSGCLLGEPGVFWVDLTYANGVGVNLVEGSFSTATPTAPGYSVTDPDQLLPRARLGHGNRVWVGSFQGINYYNIGNARPADILYPGGGLSPQQAYGLDRKMDDGNPITGNVIARVNFGYSGMAWAGPGPTSHNGSGEGSPMPGSSSTCYDNGSDASAPMHYSLNQNGGTVPNCFLSFQFQ